LDYGRLTRAGNLRTVLGGQPVSELPNARQQAGISLRTLNEGFVCCQEL
jgi:hypothetical protein